MDNKFNTPVRVDLYRDGKLLDSDLRYTQGSLDSKIACLKDLVLAKREYTFAVDGVMQNQFAEQSKYLRALELAKALHDEIESMQDDYYYGAYGDDLGTLAMELTVEVNKCE